MKRHLLLLSMMLLGGLAVMAETSNDFYNIQRGKELWEQNQLEEALESFIQETKEHPSRPMGYYYAALLLDEMGDLRSAVYYAKEAQRRFSNFDKKLDTRCDVILRKVEEIGGDSAAIARFNNLIKTFSRDIADRYVSQPCKVNKLKKMLKLLNEEKYDAVIENILTMADSAHYRVVLDSLDRRIQNDKQDPFWNLLACQVARNNRCYREAWTYFQQAQAIHPTAFTYTNMASMAFFRFCRYDLAEQCLQRAIELDSTFTDAYVLLSQIYLNTCRRDEAQKTVDRIIELSADESYAYYVRACLLRERGEYALAAEEYLKSMLAEPSQTDMYTRSAEMYLYAGDTVRYRDFMDRYTHIMEADSLPLEPEDYLVLGDTARAIQVCDSLPTERSYTGMKEYNRACVYARANAIQPALEHLRTAISQGYMDHHHMLWDYDFISLREVPEFRDMVLQCQQKSATFNDITL